MMAAQVLRLFCVAVCLSLVLSHDSVSTNDDWGENDADRAIDHDLGEEIDISQPMELDLSSFRHSAHHIELSRHDMHETHQHSVYQNLQNRQFHLGQSVTNASSPSSFLEVASEASVSKDVTLGVEVLREKHLATYFGAVNVNGNDFKVLFDTGSCEFWVPSTQCRTTRCKKHNRFPIENEPLKKYTSKQMNIKYLSGHVAGPMLLETVKVADVIVPKQIVGIAKRVDIALLDDVVWDGILGLAYPSRKLLERGITPLMDNIIQKKILTKEGMSNQLAYYIDEKGGALTLGGANCDLVTVPGESNADCINKFHFVPIVMKKYWTIGINDVSVRFPGKQDITGFCPPSGCKAIVDTGTYLMYGPAQSVRKILPASMASCMDHSQMPEITFDFKVPPNWPAAKLILKPEDYILDYDGPNGTKDCVMGISPDKDSLWTLGQVFLRTYYTLFDRDFNRVGFAHLPKGKDLQKRYKKLAQKEALEKEQKKRAAALAKKLEKEAKKAEKVKKAAKVEKAKKAAGSKKVALAQTGEKESVTDQAVDELLA